LARVCLRLVCVALLCVAVFAALVGGLASAPGATSPETASTIDKAPPMAASFADNLCT
jgi:hypothetical protein